MPQRICKSCKGGMRKNDLFCGTCGFPAMGEELLTAHLADKVAYYRKQAAEAGNDVPRRLVNILDRFERMNNAWKALKTEAQTQSIDNG